MKRRPWHRWMHIKRSGPISLAEYWDVTWSDLTAQDWEPYEYQGDVGPEPPDDAEQRFALLELE